MPSGYDPMGGNRFSEKIMLRQRQGATGRGYDALTSSLRFCSAN